MAAPAGLWFALQVGVFCSLANHQMGRSARQAGFSLIEMLLVVGILATVAGIAVPISTTFIAQAKADSANAMAIAAIVGARDRAIADRRNIELTFETPNKVRAERIEVSPPTKTIVSEVFFENGLTFINPPSGTPDSPDLFGGGTGAVRFTGTPCGTSGVLNCAMFTSDGSLIDASGDVVNGTIVLGRQGSQVPSRAITILGVTGLIRTYKWSGTGWAE